MRGFLHIGLLLLLSISAFAQMPVSYGVSKANVTNQSEVISRFLFGSGSIANPFSWSPTITSGGTDITNPNSTGNNILPCRGYSDHTLGNMDPNDGNPNNIEHMAIVERGQMYELQLVGQRCSGSGWGVPFNTQRGVKVYIDFNHDGLFDPNTENVLPLSFQGTGTGWTPTYNIFNVTIPNTAVTGTTHMRVVYSRLGTTPFFTWFQIVPQGVYQYGETHDYTIQINGLIDSVDPINISCAGANDGQIEVIPNPTAPAVLDYSISGMFGPWQSSPIFAGLSPGSYDIWVQDPATGELEEYPGNSVVLTEPSALSFAGAVTSNYNGSQISCPGANDGEITFTSNGGTAPYDYSLDNGASFVSLAQPLTYTATGLIAGSYDLLVRDANGCLSGPVNIIITSPNPLSVNTIVSSNWNGEDISCVGASDGQITMSGSGGTIPYLFEFDNGGFSPTTIISNISAGTYDVSIEDVNGCVVNVSPAITLNNPPALIYGGAIITSNYNGADVSCFGDSDGEITISGSGGTSATGDYTYLLNNSNSGVGLSPFSVTGLLAGAYDISIQDDNGCTTMPTPITLTNPPQLSITSSYVSSIVSCNAFSDGEITIDVVGGTGVYQYSIDNGGSYTTGSSVFSSLSGGLYSTLVMDDNGCIDGPVDVNLADPPVLTILSATVTSNFNGAQTSCDGSNDGEITIIGSGGTPNYNYSVTGGSPFFPSNTIGLLSAGNYDIMIEDANGCQTAPGSTVTITSPPPIITSGLVTSNYNGEDVSCNGSSDGEITIDVVGGTGATYTYMFTSANYNGPSPHVISGLSAGNYPVTVMDINGCTAPIPAISISEPAPLVITTGQLDAGCNGAADGSAWVNPSGGTPFYSYLWSNNATTVNITGLSAGNYSVVVTDVNGCQEQENIIILQPLISTIAQDATCFGADNGSIETIITNGNNSYVYLWDDLSAQSTAIATGLAPGSYTVTATDPFGCVLVATDSLSEPDELVVNILFSTLCSPTDITTIEAEVDGGIMPYSFLWNTLEIIPEIYGVDGVYSIDVTDANLCLTTQTATVPAYSPILISHYTEPASCIDNNDGLIQTNVLGGYPPYIYYWSTGQDESNIYVPSGDYMLTVTDDEGCEETSYVGVLANQATCLEVYSAFTPNGDENNDYWHIENIELYPDALVEVFNRWGNRVFASKRYTNSWDAGFTGNYNGEPLPSATYYYVITLNNDESPYKGALTIIR